MLANLARQNMITDHMPMARPRSQPPTKTDTGIRAGAGRRGYWPPTNDAQRCARIHVCSSGRFRCAGNPSNRERRLSVAVRPWERNANKTRQSKTTQTASRKSSDCSHNIHASHCQSVVRKPAAEGRTSSKGMGRSQTKWTARRQDMATMSLSHGDWGS